MSVAEEARGALPPVAPEAVGLDPKRLERLYRLIERHIEARRYPGAQVAIARHGKLAAFRTFGRARIEPTNIATTDETLFPLYSLTKAVFAAAIWRLIEEGAISLSDRVADHVPEFAANSKGEITLFQLYTHQAGFPDAMVSREAWSDHERLRREVCDFKLEWWPGTKVKYHGMASEWTAAVVLEAITGRDYREYLRSEVLDPLGLDGIQVGMPAANQERCADMHIIQDGTLIRASDPVQFISGPDPSNTSEWREAGVPAGGGYATAAALAALFQMLLNGGMVNGVRQFTPRLIRYVTSNHTGDRVDERQGMPMHRGIGLVVRGVTPHSEALGAFASPSTFGNSGVRSSVAWGDPESGLSFSYLANCRSDQPFSEQRMDRVSNLAHAALVEI